MIAGVTAIFHPVLHCYARIITSVEWNFQVGLFIVTWRQRTILIPKLPTQNTTRLANFVIEKNWTSEHGHG